MKYQERLMRDCWLALIEDHVDQPTRYAMGNFFDNHDLIDLITMAQHVADVVIFGLEPERRNNQFFRLFDFFLGGVPMVNLKLVDSEELATLLLLLRFPKRYTPEKGAPSSLPEFWERNKRMKQLEFNPNNLVIQWMRYHCHRMLQHYQLRATRVTLSSGADLEGHRTLREKLDYLLSLDPTLLGIGSGGAVQDDYPHRECVNRIKAVPKSYKTMRNIAIESQWTTYNSTPVADAILRCLPRYVNGERQEVNQNLCIRGSVDNSLATIDCSAASDSVSCALCRTILPWHVYKDILRVTSIAPREACLEYKSTIRPEYRYTVKDHYRDGRWEKDDRGYAMVSTMGNRVTFPLEELIFSAVVETAYSLTGRGRPEPSECGVVGDDIIVPTDLAMTVMDILHICGFTVNSDKSFCDSSYYRESCGAEGFHGLDISTSYWPRRVVTTNDLAVLIGMQHRFWDCPHLSLLLQKEIRRIYPKITESYPGSVYDDIWTDYPDIKLANSPYAIIARAGQDKWLERYDREDISCEIHSVFIVTPNGRVDAVVEDWYYYQWQEMPLAGVPADPVLKKIGYREASCKEALGSDSLPKLVNRRYLV